MPKASVREDKIAMTWYAAHIVLYTKFLDGIQNTFHVWENIVFINAETAGKAFTIADTKGEAEATSSLNSSYTYDNRPAVWVYAGVRKLNEYLEHFDSEEQKPGRMEEYGTEVTYSSFILHDEDALQKFLGNRDVSVLYEGFDSEPS